MKRDIWVTSDTHFNHTNILKFEPKLRPFHNVKEMNEALIENWNRKVKPGDIIYHLGDVFFGDKEEFKKLWPRLNGKKRLVVGNHDDIKFLSSGSFFQKVMLWRVFKEHNILLTHVPVDINSIRPNGAINVHGHVHSNPSPKGPYKCVCVEQTNLTPVHIESLK